MSSATDAGVCQTSMPSLSHRRLSRRLHHALDAVAAQAAVVADAFDLQPAPIDLPSQLLQVRQVGQTLIHTEIVRIAKGALGPASTTLFEILFRVEVLVLDAQTGMHAVPYDA